MTRHDVVIDCGANVGRFTAILAKSGARVIAFEPDPVAAAELKKNVAAFENVTIHQKAVGTDTGHITLYRSTNFNADPISQTVSSSVYSDKQNADTSACITVEQIDFIQFIKQFSSIRLLKMDIEGAEVPILESMIHHDLLARVDHFFVETHEESIPGLMERISRIRSAITLGGHGNINLDWR